MKLKKDDIPVVVQTPDSVLRAKAGWGGMSVAWHNVPAGSDLKPLLVGLKNDHCQCPHWGYIAQGAARVLYEDGTEELLEEGDVFYMPPGHTMVVEKDLQIIDFSPEKEFMEVMNHVKSKMAELAG